MARLAWPLIVTRHVAELPKRPVWVAAGAKVFDGPATTGDNLDAYLTLGFVPGEDTGATFEQTPDDEIDGITREDGTVAGQLTVSGQGDDISSCRLTLAALLDDWQQWLLEDNTQGGALLGHSRLQMSADISLQLTASGAAARALVAVSYIARVQP